MSNHSGSRMLNDVIQVLNDEEVLNTIGLQKSSASDYPNRRYCI
ncbi:MAG: hypothetical protein WBA39_30035 [Rivularia sp. (in: cyanobacteria)]